MSGHKQHYIPQSLLRGFTARNTAKKTYVWVYERNKHPYCPSTEGVAASRHFYSTPIPGAVTLDDVITDEIDNQLGSLLLSWRQMGDGMAVEQSTAAALVANLTIRGAFLRAVFGEGVAALQPWLKSRFGDRRWLRAYTGVDRADLEPTLQREIDERLAQLVDELPRGLPVALLRRLVMSFLRERFDSLVEQTTLDVTGLLDGIFGQVEQVVERAHRRTLSETLAPEPHIKFLSQLTWVIRVVHERKLILPDCVSLFVDSGGGRPYLLRDREDDADRGAVVVPIANDRMLVGTSLHHASIDFADVNEWSAKSSHTFFVASERTDQNDNLQSCIGELSSAAVVTLALEALDAFDDGVGGKRHSDQSSSDAAPADGFGQISFQLGMPNSWDEPLQARVLEKTRTLVLALGEFLPLARLDRLTYAIEFEAAVFDVSGTAAQSPPSDRIGTSMACIEPIEKDGGTYFVAVVRASVGEDLVAENEVSRLTAASTLVNVIARVAFRAMLDDAVTRFASREIPEPVERVLFQATSGIGSAFFSARVASGISPATRSDLQALSSDLLQALANNIQQEKVAFHRHQDIDKTVLTCLTAINSFLTAIAAYLGELGGDMPNSDALDAVELDLEQYGLVDWIRTFGQDLKPFANNIRRVVAKDLVRLTSHVERLLWAFGVFCIEQPDGRVYFLLLPNADPAAVVEPRPAGL